MTNAALAAKVAAHKREAIANLQEAKHAAQAKADELRRQHQAQAGDAAQRLEAHRLLDCGIPGLFPTPPDLADRMVALACIREGDRVLEPSAGTGNIAAAIQRAGFDCQCVEIAWSLAELLRKRGYTVTCADFLETGGQFDRIIMNPPFEHQADAIHVQHAFSLLTPGGRIVAIVSEGVFHNSNARAAGFRDWLDDLGAEVEKLPDGTFKSSRANVSVRLVVIDRAELDHGFSRGEG